jgi:hypothetical protein
MFMDNVPRHLRMLVAAAVLLAGAAGSARGEQTPAAWIVWSCWMGNDKLFSLHCTLASAPAFAPAGQRPGLPFDHDKYRHDLFATGGAPNVAHLVRADHATYGGTLWRIPLYAPPIDNDDVKHLALSVMCGRDPRCVVEFESLILAADCSEWVRGARAAELQSNAGTERRATVCVPAY